MSQELTKCLDDLESRIDPPQEEGNLRQWQEFLDGRCQDEVFVPTPRRPAPAKVAWPSVSVNQAIRDGEAMLFQQFRECSDVLAGGGGGRLNVRCNYGTGILPSLFGCRLFMMDEELNTLPTAIPLGSAEHIKPLLDAGVPGTSSGLGGKVFEVCERFIEAMRPYPKIRGYVSIYHPDVQGPMDVTEVVWGSDVFYAFYEAPDMVRAMISLVTETYAAFMRRWFALVPPEPVYNAHWSALQKGTLAIRNDSLMNLSPEMYVDFVRPNDQRLFDEFGGGTQHFCGRGDHFIEAMSQMKGLSGVFMSQPHLNDMEKIYRNTVDKGIKLLNFDAKTARTAGRPLRGQVHCRRWD
ncbi:MAG: hypothetical protein ACE15C_07015 [Phycisphaerae bacterium]